MIAPLAMLALSIISANLSHSLPTTQRGTARGEPYIPTTTMLIGTSPTVPRVGQPITALFSVRAGSEAVSGGLVQILLYDALACQANTGGGACAFSIANPGEFPLQAQFDGDGDYLPSQSEVLLITVEPPSQILLDGFES